ncbi:hypothetical protein E3_0160 [Rhodococcus phage E3]|uniref:hypothetical protein n=1 Tax=Rhodococcus phage E3 TaxID=1007869 RepID=UPI0002C6C592|nr:hypothetical protein M176_gp016 [Rhodococcus phage E3]AEQ20926.1 hypothetical protein E3_0160 [Rhodococcus phage E3]
MPYAMGEQTLYLLLGHPAWRGNLDTASERDAIRWVEEHQDEHPVYVDVVHTNRSRLYTSPLKAKEEGDKDLLLPLTGECQGCGRNTRQAIIKPGTQFPNPDWDPVVVCSHCSYRSKESE